MVTSAFPRFSIVLGILCFALNGCSDEAAKSGSAQTGAGGVPANGGASSSGSGGTSGGATGGASGGVTASGGSSAGGQSTGGQSAGGTGSGSASGGTAAGCAGKAYLVCEDFDTSELGGTPDGWTKHGDESEVADDAAYSGAQSLKLGAIPNWERRIYHDASMLGSAHWGRIRYRVKLPVPDAFVHSTLVALVGVGPNIGEAEYRVVDTVKAAFDAQGIENKHQFLYNVQPNGAEFGQGTTYDWTFEEEWHCAEWHVDASDQSYAFYLDGDEVLSFARGPGNYEGAEIPSSFSEVRVGWINYQTAPPGFTAWIDDVALDDDRIGCSE